MASGPAYGFLKEQLDKQKDKYDSEMELEVIKWINSRVPEDKIPEGCGPDVLREHLKSGIKLIRLINTYPPSAVKEGRFVGRLAFDTERIGFFLKAGVDLGWATHSKFEAVDLRDDDKHNMTQVVAGLFGLGRHLGAIKAKPKLGTAME